MGNGKKINIHTLEKSHWICKCFNCFIMCQFRVIKFRGKSDSLYKNPIFHSKLGNPRKVIAEFLRTPLGSCWRPMSCTMGKTLLIPPAPEHWRFIWSWQTQMCPLTAESDFTQVIKMKLLSLGEDAIPSSSPCVVPKIVQKKARSARNRQDALLLWQSRRWAKGP